MMHSDRHYKSFSHDKCDSTGSRRRAYPTASLEEAFDVHWGGRFPRLFRRSTSLQEEAPKAHPAGHPWGCPRPFGVLAGLPKLMGGEGAPTMGCPAGGDQYLCLALPLVGAFTGDLPKGTGHKRGQGVPASGRDFSPGARPRQATPVTRWDSSLLTAFWQDVQIPMYSALI
eukprot:Polyplicarium_translucidae@DN3375_c0_g1_i2.p2